jgi:hypothetical protein
MIAKDMSWFSNDIVNLIGNYTTADTYQAEADGETLANVNVTRVERNPFGYIIHDEESSGNE